jgi:hypothetical protein
MVADHNDMPTIAGYQITRLLRHGGMADVYLGTQLSLARSVAIKVLAAMHTQGLEAVARFEHEARTIARLDHPHIVSIFDVGSTDDGRLYYTMPYLPRGDLDERRVDEAGIIAILRGLCSALGYAHDHGVIHRDVKPGNILFDPRDRPLLADFGIALTTRDVARVTREGSTIGSNGYMSPEQARGLPLDGRADLYSLGVVAYELLSGDLPFHGPDTLSMALAHVEQPVPRLAAQRRRWQTFIDRAMAKRPEDRFASAAEMAAALDAIEAILDDARGAAVSPAMSSWLAPIGASALIVAGVSLFGFAVWRGDAQRVAVDAPADHARAAATVPAALQTAAVVQKSGTASSALPAPGPGEAGAFTQAPVPAPRDANERAKGAAALTETSAKHARDAARSQASIATAPPLAAGAALHDSNGPPLVFVPAENEGAAHGFAMARHEVTRAEFAAFVAATGYQASACRQPLQPLSRLKKLSWRDPGFAQDDHHPVLCVSWRDASAYVQWLSGVTHAAYGLPTRAEWKQAARAEPAGDGVCSRGNLAGHRALPFLSRDGCKDAVPQTAPVGQFRPNMLGIYDLVGNVSEWTADCAGRKLDTQGRCSEHFYTGTSWRDKAGANNLDADGDADADVGYTNVGLRVIRKLGSGTTPLVAR